MSGLSGPHQVDHFQELRSTGLPSASQRLPTFQSAKVNLPGPTLKNVMSEVETVALESEVLGAYVLLNRAYLRISLTVEPHCHLAYSIQLR